MASDGASDSAGGAADDGAGGTTTRGAARGAVPQAEAAADVNELLGLPAQTHDHTGRRRAVREELTHMKAHSKAKP